MSDFTALTYHTGKTVQTATTGSLGLDTGSSLLQSGSATLQSKQTVYKYTFDNFFHPFIGELIAKLNRESLTGMLDPTWQASLATPDPASGAVSDFFTSLYRPTSDSTTSVTHHAKEIDLSEHGPYANYNWELLFHIPLTIATHLSKMQRFADAQRWFHYIFNPTSTDTSASAPERYWNFLEFRRVLDPKQIDYLLALLSAAPSSLSSDDQKRRADVLDGYAAILNKPFQPHAVARTRHLAYQYSVVMKYLDNLIAWGDQLFQQDTIESINEATQRYVLAANILGPRPQRVPSTGTIQRKTFGQLRASSLDAMGNALVDLEAQFPFNLSPVANTGNSGSSAALFGMGRTLYFCIPRNDKMLGYWDIVADRLFKIRHCMNLQGIVRPLALFDPPIDPGMLVKAAAAGIDVGNIVNGLNQPIGPVRSLMLIQKAAELCAEVKSLGGALLSAIEKGEAEHLSTMRQRHEIQIQELTQEVKFLQWQSARESTTSLLTARKAALERLHFYQRVLGLPADQNAPDAITLDRRDLTEANFDEAYAALVGQYDKPLTLQQLSRLSITGGSSPSNQSGASSSGALYLNSNENADLNIHSPEAARLHTVSASIRAAAPVLSLIPKTTLVLAFWGLGGSIAFSGEQLAKAATSAGEIVDIFSSLQMHKATSASKTASFQRRADDWMLQYNNAAHELMQNGRQILTSLIAEQVAHHEYLNTKQQIANTREIDQYLHEKYTNEELYLWMQGEISRLYYEYYRFAFDTARKAERTMKQELMRPELDAQDFVKFNYWDGGRKGLLAGEALYLDVKRMEMAYHENNKRELELTRHISLRQLDPYALLLLKSTGSCQVAIPEWLYDRDCPGHYMRRIKSVALSIPSVVGPYTSINCTLSLLRSSLRTSPMSSDGANYLRQDTSDSRFTDMSGAIQSIVTSSANNDGGMFETNLRDERFLPFEGAGAISSWQLDLPKDYPAFDFGTISDVILHIRYTARQGVNPDAVISSLDTLFQQTTPTPNLALLFNLRRDFPTEWAAFINGTGSFTAQIRKEHFPYLAQVRTITVTGLEFYAEDVSHHKAATTSTPITLGIGTGSTRVFTVTGTADTGSNPVLSRDDADAETYLIVRYGLS